MKVLSVIIIAKYYLHIKMQSLRENWYFIYWLVIARF